MAHPFAIWRQRLGIDRTEAVERLRTQRGRETSVGYLSLLEQGHRRPSFEFGDDMAAITRGDVSVVEIMRWQRADATPAADEIPVEPTPDAPPADPRRPVTAE